MPPPFAFLSNQYGVHDLLNKTVLKGKKIYIYIIYNIIYIYKKNIFVNYMTQTYSAENLC